MSRRSIGRGNSASVSRTVLAFRIGLAAVALQMVLALPLCAASMGASGGHDLDALWSRAQKRFALSDNDAVVLLEGRYSTVSAEGDLVTRIHRVVWIGSEVGTDTYADLRVPWNSATSSLTVTALRTWRDDAWWPDASEISETAVVETLPFAAASAVGYASMRETMLLHDGVGIPCIVETMYEIRERGAAAGGWDDLFVFPQRDPAVLVEFALTVPGGAKPHYYSGNGAPEPTVTHSDAAMTTYLWRMEEIDRRGSPPIAAPAVNEPYATWSTWKDWSALGRALISSFDGAAVLDAALADTLAGRLENEPTLESKARRIAALVDEYTRNVHYDWRFWEFSPRPATRTYETAYGHALDRAVLAAALFRQAGIQAELLLHTAVSVRTDRDVPGLGPFQEPALSLGGGLRDLYDPSEGRLRDGPRALDGRVAWRPETQDAPAATPTAAGIQAESRLELALTLEPAAEGGWSGTGFLDSDGALCPYDEMAGLDGEALARVKRIVGSVLSGADADAFNPEEFAPAKVAAGFDVSVKAQEPDDYGLVHLVVGEPAGGVIDALPSDVRLFHEQRTSPVVRFGTQWQRITLRLKAADGEIVQLPEARELENEVGHFLLTVERENGWLKVDRMLMLGDGPVAPEAWPQLRALLLEETDPVNGTILLKASPAGVGEKR